MNVSTLDAQIEKEIACIKHLHKRISNLHRRGLYEKAIVCFQDIRKSEQRITELKAQKDRIKLEQSRFYNTVQTLRERGILTKPVKKVREVVKESMANC